MIEIHHQLKFITNFDYFHFFNKSYSHISSYFFWKNRIIKQKNVIFITNPTIFNPYIFINKKEFREIIY